MAIAVQRGQSSFNRVNETDFLPQKRIDRDPHDVFSMSSSTLREIQKARLLFLRQLDIHGSLVTILNALSLPTQVEFVAARAPRARKVASTAPILKCRRRKSHTYYTRGKIGLSQANRINYLEMPKAGLEPACLAAPPPQDGVSANSTTSAN